MGLTGSGPLLRRNLQAVVLGPADHLRASAATVLQAGEAGCASPADDRRTTLAIGGNQAQPASPAPPVGQPEWIPPTHPLLRLGGRLMLAGQWRTRRQAWWRRQ